MNSLLLIHQIFRLDHQPDDHFLFIKPYNNLWFEKENIRELNIVLVMRRKLLQFIFKIITQDDQKSSDFFFFQ